jgi:hypothetical protein
MKEKIGFYSSLLFSLLFGLLLVDTILWLAGKQPRLPGSHKQILLAGFILWFVSLVSGRDRDDDWAGQL